MNKIEIVEYIDKRQADAISISDKIYDYAELSLEENRSANLYIESLEAEGFEVCREVANIQTAFTATYGKGRPIIGILAEYDALDSLSQIANTVKKEKDPNKDNGHGCGHNLLGAGSYLASLAIKEYLKDQRGTIILYGCPGEEGKAAKAFMAKANMFYQLDAALTWHPSDKNAVTSGTCNASIQIEYSFDGIASHAAGDPHLGRSALDGVELMNLGVQFLREHMPSHARVHYAITDTGGVSPNVVQSHARVLYMIRGGSNKETLALLKRVDQIAEAAAMMSETTMTKRFIDGSSDLISNSILEKVLYTNFKDLNLPYYSDEELSFAKQLQATYTDESIAEFLANNSDIKDQITESLKQNHVIANFLMPYQHHSKRMMGSTDVGDVSYQTPTAQITAVTWPLASPGHSWQNVAIGKHSIAHKGIIMAAKVLALTAIDLYEDENLLIQAKQEHQDKTKDGYLSLIIDDAVEISL
ncbi:MAG: amidohydrolase [Erysipelotrichaceae bacterium]|nr:amidohydrolase [Erysipelotrichaceae bacterium]MDD3924436.1 amidohydrolase [Erysipelotrichaceae bacterium]